MECVLFDVFEGFLILNKLLPERTNDDFFIDCLGACAGAQLPDGCLVVKKNKPVVIQ